jgi:hypothetical protein
MKALILTTTAVLALSTIGAAPVLAQQNRATSPSTGATAPGNDGTAPHAQSRDATRNGGQNNERFTNCDAVTGNKSANSGTGNSTAMNCEPAASGSSQAGKTAPNPARKSNTGKE